MALSSKEKKELFEEFKKELIKPITMYVEVLDEDVILPSYANVGDAGMDIRATKDIVLLPGETKVVPTGIKVVIPEGYELQIRPRSGVSLKSPLRLANTPGTIDSGYREEIGIIVTNSSSMITESIELDEKTNAYIYKTQKTTKPLKNYTIEDGKNRPGVYSIKKGDRIAQIVLMRYETIEFKEIEDVKKIGSNRGGGLGSTGIRE